MNGGLFSAKVTDAEAERRAGRPGKRASNLAGGLACEQVSKRAKQAGSQAGQASSQASWLARETQKREKQERGHMTSLGRREGSRGGVRGSEGLGWARASEGGGRGIDRTTRTAREYIPQHGGIRRRRRYMGIDGAEREGRRECFEASLVGGATVASL